MSLLFKLNRNNFLYGKIGTYREIKVDNKEQCRQEGAALYVFRVGFGSFLGF